jgi:hypothetical protein
LTFEFFTKFTNSKREAILKVITIILFFLLQFLFTNSFGQLWYITSGLSADDDAWGVDVDSAGNVYWAVEEKDQWPYWYFNIFFFKIDSSAHQVWQNPPWGGTYNDIAFITTVKNSKVYLSGRADSNTSPTSGDALVLSYDNLNGGFNWQYNFNPVPDYGYQEIDDLISQPDGIYLSGWNQSQDTNDMDFLVQKISLTGQLIWSYTWDYNDLGRFDGANGHMAMDDNFLYLAGHVNRTNIGSFDGDGALVCFSRINGAYQWNVTWGGALYDDALGLTMSSDSMLYVVGYTGSFENGSQTWLNKYSRSGQLKWSRLWGGTGTEDSRALVADGDSIIFVVGSTSSYGKGGKDIFILKFDSAGTLIDSLFWGGAYDEVAHDVAKFGNYLYITGRTHSYGNGKINGDHKSDGLLLKVNGKTMQAPDSSMTHIDSPFPDLQGSVVIYPNPCTNSLTIRITDQPEASPYELNIFNLLGDNVFQKSLTKSQETIGMNFPCGLYIFKITNKQGNIYEGKIIIVNQ